MAGPRGPIDGLIHNELKKLLKIMQREGLEEVSLAHGDTRITLRRAGASGAATAGTDVEFSTRLDEVPERETAAEEGQAPRKRGRPRKRPLEEGAGPATATLVIRSPMVGTFYRATAPTQPPLVDVGDRVETGQPVAVVEAMKLMNEVNSEVSGTVEEVLVENGQMVEFGQPLFRLRP